MDDRKLTELFHTLEAGLELPGPEGAFADALYGRLRTEAAPRRFSRPMLLLVAALLLVAVTAVAVAIGSGVIDPAPDEDALLPVELLPAHEVDCGEPPAFPEFIFTLPEGVFLEAEVGPLEPQAYGEMRPGQRLFIFEDGLVVVGGRLTVSNSAPNPERPLPEQTARRLSPTGMALVTRAVADSGLLLRDCGVGLRAESGTRRPYRGLAVRSPDGGVAITSWGSFGGRPMTDAEQAAAETLVAQLEDLAAWLPAEAWIQLEPEPHEPAWMVWTERHSPDNVAMVVDPQLMAEAFPARSVRLPGGETLLGFGSEYSEPPPSSDLVGRAGRCAVGTRAAARAMAAELGDANGIFGSSGWWFEEDGDWIRVQMRPAVIGQDMVCRPGALFTDYIYLPVDPPVSEVDREFDIDPCTLLESMSVREAFGLPDQVYIGEAEEDPFVEAPGYLSCYWFSGISGGVGFDGIPWGGHVQVAVRTETTTGEEAEELAAQLNGVVADAIKGQTTWQRECSSTRGGGSSCESAIMVSTPPFFVIVEILHGDDEFELTLEALRPIIPEILENLAAWHADQP